MYLEYKPDDPNNQIYVECDQINCTACTVEQLCTPLFQELVKEVKPPIHFRMRNIGLYNETIFPPIFDNEFNNNIDLKPICANYTKVGTFQMDFLTSILNLQNIECFTGTCVDHIPIIPTVKYDSFLWIVLIILV